VTNFSRAARHRWGLFAAWVGAAVFPAVWLVVMFAPVTLWASTMPRVFADFLAGPVLYWAPALQGGWPEFDLHPMAGLSTWVYAVCVPLAFAHPARPGPFTATVTSAAFIAWYGWAWLTFVAFNAPC
jgi:hypothetical protein